MCVLLENKLGCASVKLYQFLNPIKGDVLDSKLNVEIKKSMKERLETPYC